MLSVSSLIHDYYGIDDVYLSLPAVIGRRGVERIVPLGLSAEEASGLPRSAELLHETIGHLGSTSLPDAIAGGMTICPRMGS